MASKPIKHMTYEEAGAEYERLQGLAQELDLKIQPLTDRADYFDHLAIGWTKKMSGIAATAAAIGSMEEPIKGEIPRLLELNEAYFARYMKRIRQRNAAWADRSVLYDAKERISRRQRRVIDRGWETFGPRDPDRINVLWRTPRAVDLEVESASCPKR